MGVVGTARQARRELMTRSHKLQLVVVSWWVGGGGGGVGVGGQIAGDCNETKGHKRCY